MNREDQQNHQLHYRGSFPNRRHNNRAGPPNPYWYDQGSWIDNPPRKPFFSRSRWHKTTQHVGGKNKHRRPYAHPLDGHLPPKPVAPPPKPPSPLPKPASPLPGSEEYFQRNIQLNSGVLRKQLEEFPDTELVLPRNNQMNEDNDENILPAMRFLQAAVETNNAELLSAKRKAKKAAQIANDKSVSEIVERVRTLQRQKRVKATREIRDFYNKKLNLQDCEVINTILPDISVKLEVLPEEFISKLSNELNIDLEPLPLDGVDLPLHVEEAENSNYADGDAPYDPFDVEFVNLYDNNVHEARTTPTQQDHRLQECPPVNNMHDNNCYDAYAQPQLSPEDDCKQEEQEYTRSVIRCHIRPGKADARGPTKLKLKREPIDLTREENLENSLPPGRHDFSQIDSRREVTPPPPPQISEPWPSSVTDRRSHRRSEKRNIRVIAEANEVYNNRETDATSIVDVMSSSNVVIHDHDRPSKAEDVNANGYHNQLDDEIEYRANFELGEPKDDEWNRQIIVKSTDRVRRDIATELAPDAKPPDNTHFKTNSNFTKLEPPMQNGDVQYNSVNNSVKELVEKLPAQVKSAQEELNYEPDTDDAEEDAEEEGQSADACVGTFQEPEADDSLQDVSDIDNLDEEIAAPVNEKDDGKAQEAGTAIIVLEPTGEPGTFKTKRGKLHMYCKNVAAVDGVGDDQIDKLTASEAPETEQTQSASMTVTNTHSVEEFSAQSGKDTQAKKRKVADADDASKEAKRSKPDAARTTNRSVQTSASKHYYRSTPNEVKRTNRRTQTEPDKTTLGKLREKYNRHKRKTRETIKKLNVIDKQLETLLAERRQVCKTLEALASTSESEEEVVVTNNNNNNNDKKKEPAKYILISVDGSTPSKVNPVLSSNSPSEQVLTQVLPKDSEDIPNPGSPSDYMMHSMDMDIFSMISEQNKAGPADMEIRDETFTETSNTMPEAETAECENDAELGGMMSISETVPADILEPSDSENINESPLKNQVPIVKLIKYNLDDLNRLKQDILHKPADDSLHRPNSNVKLEHVELGNVETEMIGEFFSDDCRGSPNVIDFVGWKDSIIVIKAIKNLIVAGNDKGKLFYYDTQSAYPIYSETVSTRAITSIVAFENRDGARLIIASLDGQLYMYDVEGRQVLKVTVVAMPIQCMEMAWNGVYMGSPRGDLFRCCLTKWKVSTSVNVSQECVLAIRCSMEGARRIIIVAMRNAPISIRDASTFLQLRTLGGVRCSAVYSLVLHDNRLYCGTSHEDVLAFNFHDGQLMFKLNESKGSGIVCMTSVGKLLFVGCYSGHIYVYHTADNKFITLLPAPAGLLLSMAVVNKKLIAATKLNFQCIPLPAAISNML